MCVVKHLLIFIRSAAFASIWIVHPLNASSISFRLQQLSLIWTSAKSSVISSESSKFSPSSYHRYKMSWTHLAYSTWSSLVDCQEQIYFKILLLTYKTVHGHDPAYIHNLISLTTFKSLRSASQLALKPGPRFKTSSYGAPGLCTQTLEQLMQQEGCCKGYCSTVWVQPDLSTKEKKKGKKKNI